jgi:hypothetical protein
MLRPQGVQTDDYAVIVLEGDSAARMGRAQKDLASLGRDPIAWWAAIQQAFNRGDISLGLALLYALDGPG